MPERQSQSGSPAENSFETRVASSFCGFFYVAKNLREEKKVRPSHEVRTFFELFNRLT